MMAHYLSRRYAVVQDVTMAPIADFAKWITHAQTPRVEQMLKHAAKSNTVSFAGGLPAEEMFPVGAIEAAFSSAISQQAAEALQYNWSEGFEPLREQIAARMRARGMDFSAGQILVTHGAQQALDLLAKFLARPGNPVALESPTYVPAIQAFELQQAKLYGVDRGENGIDLNSLEDQLKNIRPKLLYLVPTGHNPTGTSLSHEARQELLRVCAQFETIVIEDDAYGELQYDHPQPPLRSLSKDERLVFVGSFSKILSPGLRIGWIAASEAIIKQIALIKQAADLQTSTLNQLVLSKFLKENSIEVQVGKGVAFYRQRRDVMLRALRENLPPEYTWIYPDSAFSVWVSLPDGMNAETLLSEAVSHGVAFEPGKPFFVGTRRENTMRLSFSNQPEGRIISGVQKLGEVCRNALVGR
jgi:2-aminoadipate transaminase